MTGLVPAGIQGLGLGLAIAAPVGPIGILCIQRTLERGPIIGFATGLGAATADGLYGLAAAAGLAAMAMAFPTLLLALRLGGALFLVALGLRALIRPPAEAAAARASSGSGLAAAYGSGLILTLSNPATILSSLAMFAGLGVAGDQSAAAALVIGVFLGSAAWWLVLAAAITRLGAHLGPRARRLTHRLSAVTLTAFGLVALAGVAAGRG